MLTCLLLLQEGKKDKTPPYAQGRVPPSMDPQKEQRGKDMDPTHGVVLGATHEGHKHRDSE